MSAVDTPDDWARVAALTPALAAGVDVQRHRYRGVTWFVLSDSAASKHLRLAEGAWRIAGLLDGRRSLADVHTALVASGGDDAPDRSSILRLLADLHASELIDCAELNDARQFETRRRRHERMRWKRVLSSPVSQRLPLVDPQAWLDRRLNIVAPVFTRAGLAAWALVMAWGLALIVSNFGEIVAGFSLTVLSTHNLVVMVVAYVAIKALHELGHAFALRVFGGEVHEMGIMFLVFLPVPYVDASASNAFADKSRRIAVGAAGIAVEMFLSVLALGVWLAVEPGLIRDFAFNVMLVAGLSTLLFNGNPLLRFDGYYVLCDVLEIPNLGSRSTRYLGYLFQRYLCGAAAAQSPVSAPGERRWFLIYGIASFLYRISILVAIGLFVAQRFPVVGVILCLWLAVSQGLLPIVRGVRGLIGAPVLAGRRGRAALVAGAPLAFAVVAIAAVPMPAWTYAEGVVWLPERSQVRAGGDGFVGARFAQPQSRVDAGDVLFELEAVALQAETAILERRVEEQQARYDAALFHDRERLEVLQQQLGAAQRTLADARSRLAALSVRSPLAGTLVVPRSRHLQGRFIRKGEILGYVADGRPQTARVVVRQREIDRVRDDTQNLRLQLPGYPGRVFAGEIASVTPAAVRDLPSVALGASGGGRIPVDASDGSGHTPAESIFVLEITLPLGAPQVPAGTRVFLRFEHRGASLGRQLTRAGRQLLLSKFGI